MKKLFSSLRFVFSRKFSTALSISFLALGARSFAQEILYIVGPAGLFRREQEVFAGGLVVTKSHCAGRESAYPDRANDGFVIVCPDAPAVSPFYWWPEFGVLHEDELTTYPKKQIARPTIAYAFDGG